MSILAEAYQIYNTFYRSLMDESIFNSNDNVIMGNGKISFSIKGITFTFIKNDRECCYLDKDTETIYLEKVIKGCLVCNRQEFNTEINKWNIFIGILCILILRMDNINFSNEVESNKYLNAMLFINHTYANGLQSLLKKDFYDKEIICAWLVNFEFNTIGNRLITYIKELTDNEYREFTNIIDQELTLCKIENTNLRTLSIV